MIVCVCQLHANYFICVLLLSTYLAIRCIALNINNILYKPNVRFSVAKKSESTRKVKKRKKEYICIHKDGSFISYYIFFNSIYNLGTVK